MLLALAAALAAVLAAPATTARPSIRVTLTTPGFTGPQPGGQVVPLRAVATTVPKGDVLMIEMRRPPVAFWTALRECAGTRCSATHREEEGVDVLFRARVVKRKNLGHGPILSVAARSPVTTVTWQPSLSIADASTPPGGGPTNQTIGFPVQLSARSTKTVTVSYATGDGTVKAPSDYTATTGTLTFAPGQTSQTISVPVPGDNPALGDSSAESSETFTVTLSAPTDAFLGRAAATGTILNDDPPTPPAGSYQGRTDQGYDIGFDVAPDLSNVNTLNFGLTEFCQPEFGKGFFSKDENLGFLVPVPVEQPAWTFDTTLSDSYPSGETLTVRISGTLGLDGNATGQLDVDDANRPSDRGPMQCSSGTVHFTAVAGAPPG